MAISKDSIEQRIDQLSTQEELNDTQFEQPVDLDSAEPNPYEGLLGEPEIVETQEPEPIEVAGLKDVVVGVAKRMSEAERKVVPPIPDKPVQQIGASMVVREATSEEVAELAGAIGGQYTKGLNVVRIGDNIDAYDVGEHLARVKDANSGLFETQRRGVLNMEKLEEMAMQQGVDNIVAEWLGRAPGTGETAEKILAGMIAARQVSNETVESLRIARDLPEGQDREAAFEKFFKLMVGR